MVDFPARAGVRAEVEEFDELMDELSQTSTSTSLSVFIHEAYQAAANYRRQEGIDSTLDYCFRAVNSEYTAEERARLGITDANDIYAPITATKCNALASWLRDIFVNAEDKPWTLDPTEAPELNPVVEMSLFQRVIQDFTGQNVPPEVLADYMARLRQEMRPEIEQAARRGLDELERFIADQLDEGGFRLAFDGFVSDLSIYPNAFIRGPFLKPQTKLRWEGGRLVPKQEMALAVERVAPHNVFPSPNSTNPQNGAYIIERMYLSADTLRSLAKQGSKYGFDADQIQALLVRHPHGYDFGFSAATEPDAALDTADQPDVDKRYEVAVYYGYVRRAVLEDHLAGKMRSYSSAPSEVAHVEVWLCDTFVLRVVELDDGALRPLFTTSFQPIPGEFWGRSLPMLLKQIQRGANACLRSLVENMAYSTGPIFELDTERLEIEDDLSEILPGRIFRKTSTPTLVQTAQPAVLMHTIDSQARQLLGVYDRFERMADDASGIPAYVVGAPQLAGAGRTLGGLALLMGNAAKGIKRVVSNIDKHVIEPLVSSAYYNLARVRSEEIFKLDAQVKARGASGLLQRELTQARALELLQLLTPYVQAGQVPADAITVLLREVVASLGFSPDELVPEPGRQQRVEEIINQAVGGGASQLAVMDNVGGLNVSQEVLQQLQGLSGAPQVQLDKRSQPPPNPADAERLPPSE